MRIIIIIKNQLELKNMESQNNSSCTSFFESVAHHNLERFHSESIAWIFKTFPNSAKYFIKSIHEGISSIDKIHFKEEDCLAESNQIDILLKYSYNGKNYQIIIENKIKASEHKINPDKLITNLSKIKPDDRIAHLKDFILLNDSEKSYLSTLPELSQTEFYYLREKIERVEQIVEFELKKLKEREIPKDEVDFINYLAKDSASVKSVKISKKSFKNDCIKYFNELIKEELINKDFCRYVYLKPSRVDPKDINTDFDLEKLKFDFEKLNDWHQEELGNNPWKTITYQDLVKIFNEKDAFEKSQEPEGNIDIDIAIAYRNYIENNFKETVDLNNFIENKWAKFDYFKLLFALVKLKLEINNKDIDYKEYIHASSANGGMPLFAFYKRKELDKKYTFFQYIKSNDQVINPTINVGIQLQGENLKYYVSADKYQYDEIKVKNPEDDKSAYENFVKPILTYISKNDRNFEDKEGFHPNKTKTFYSRSYKIEDFIENSGQKRNINKIADDIYKSVNAFIIKFDDIDNIIANYERENAEN